MIFSAFHQHPNLVESQFRSEGSKMKIKSVKASPIDLTPRPTTHPRVDKDPDKGYFVSPMDRYSHLPGRSWTDSWTKVACLVTAEDGTWRIAFTTLSKMDATTVASVEKGRQSTGRLQVVPRRHRNRRTSQLVENSDRISPQLSRSFSRARLRSCRTRSRVTPRQPPISSRVIGSRSSSPK